MDVHVPQMQLPPITGQVWLASRLLNRQVVNAATLEPVGRVKDVVFDPKKCQVTALGIHATPPVDFGWMTPIRRMLGRSGSAGYVTLEHIVSLNGDVIVVDSAPGRATSLHVSRMPHLCEVCELAIITLHGVCLGSFADLLVDDKGSSVVGYVVNPAKQAEKFMLSFDEIELAPPPFAERAAAVASDNRVDDAGVAAIAMKDADAHVADGADISPAESVSLAHLRIIPASSRVRIGDSLIMVFEDVEPLGQDPVVVRSQVQVGAQVVVSPPRQSS